MLPPLYPILDPDQTNNRPPEFLLNEMLAAGVKLVQLRVKTREPREFHQLAMRTRELTRRAGCRLIVNDRVDIALACDADGVHLGQEDLPIAAARQLMRDRLIGISTHDVDQAREAARAGADYIGFGPIFGTATKQTAYTARGISMLREVRAAVTIPIAAIGGITENNAPEVWRAGADSAAIISDLLRADEIGAKIRRLFALHENALKPE